MALEHELSNLPEHSIMILKFMAQHPNGIRDADIQAGTRLSENTFGKSLRHLVTRRFLSMNPSSRSYNLTAKGSHAIEILATGAIDNMGSQAGQRNIVLFDLCAIIPSRLAPDEASELLLGVHPAGPDVPAQPTDLYLRLTTDDAEILPDETILGINPEQASNSTPLMITPNSGLVAVRIYIEVYQLFEIEEPAMAGGMYFDVQVGQDTGQVRAIHTPLSLV